MTLRLHNTLTGKLEDFVPQRKDRVSVYTCGLTVQAEPHVGHIRAAMSRDILTRWLEYLGYSVVSIENFTDVDDKIFEKQQEYKTDWRKIAESNIAKYLWACDALNIKRATFYPRASQHMQEIISLIETLVRKGFAYEKKGDVYFKVRTFEEYGRLSKKSIDELMVGARVDPRETKDDPLDFALWKAAKQGEAYWLSPWGKGRPGWHIECSAMSMHYLGEYFDIHTGGEDLIFPHHENEIAQSVSATGKPYVRYWLHTGWVTLTGEKMSKSTGHYSLVEDVLREYAPNVIRMYLIKTQYRNQIDFSFERLNEARAAYQRIQTYVYGYKDLPPVDKPLLFDDFTEAMNDDLNTPKALGIVYDLVSRGYEEEREEIAASVKWYLDILGFAEDVPEQPFDDVMKAYRDINDRLRREKRDDLVSVIQKTLYESLVDSKVNEIYPLVILLLLRVRDKLRAEKNYEFADFIRKRLMACDITIQDLGDTSHYRLEVK